jgi:hypothetical protein
MSNVRLHQDAHRAMSEHGAEATSVLFGDDVIFIDQARSLTLA